MCLGLKLGHGRRQWRHGSGFPLALPSFARVGFGAWGGAAHAHWLPIGSWRWRCPDGRRAVSASDDRTLKAWDLQSGAIVAAFTCDGAAYSCAFADAHTIVAGDAGGHLHFLRLEEPKPTK